MDEKQTELIEKLFTNGTYDARRAKSGRPVWLDQCEGQTISEKVWLHFNERPKCKCGKFTTFLTYSSGYRRACGLVCGQALIADQKSIRLERYWANPEWKASAELSMKTAHMNNRAQAKLDKVAERDIVLLDPLQPGMQNMYRWRHSCGEVFERPFTRITAIWCPSCHVSRGQGELYEEIRSLYKGQIYVNDRAAIRPKEIDIYLPDLKLGFQYHGEYWHPGDGSREAEKIKLAAERGIHIEEIWETLWKHKRASQVQRLKELLKTSA